MCDIVQCSVFALSLSHWMQASDGGVCVCRVLADGWMDGFVVRVMGYAFRALQHDHDMT